LLVLTKTKVVREALLVAVSAAMLAVTSAAPATAAPAAVAGAGAGSGFDYPEGVQDPPGNCFPNVTAIEVQSNRLEADHLGTYDGFDVNGVKIASYNGPSHVTVEAGPHLISPLGTHSSCDPLGLGAVPAAIPIRATVTSPGALPNPVGGGSVSCPGPAANTTNGTWLRVGTTVVITFTSTCTVTGNVPLLTSTVSAPTTHVLTYEGVPCTIPPTPIPNPACLDPDAGAAYAGTYSAAGAITA
jgi:hypothetical protein